METKPKSNPRQKIYNFLFSLPGLTLLLALLACAFVFTINLFNHHFTTAVIEWFRNASPGADSSAVLIAVGSISVVVWTGALIAFQLRGTSAQLSGAFSLLQYAFVAPLLGLLFQGGTLRLISAMASFVFFALVTRQLLLYFVLDLIRRRTVSAKQDREFLATDFGRRLIQGAAELMIFPVSYASTCIVTSLVIAGIPTQYTVAVASVATLCFGLYFILVALNTNKVPPTPEQRAIAEKQFEEMISIFRRKAEEIRPSAVSMNNSAATSLESPVETDAQGLAR